jgi:hypothetical protein
VAVQRRSGPAVTAPAGRAVGGPCLMATLDVLQGLCTLRTPVVIAFHVGDSITCSCKRRCPVHVHSRPHQAATVRSIGLSWSWAPSWCNQWQKGMGGGHACAAAHSAGRSLGRAERCLGTLILCVQVRHLNKQCTALPLGRQTGKVVQVTKLNGQQLCLF